MQGLFILKSYSSGILGGILPVENPKEHAAVEIFGSFRRGMLSSSACARSPQWLHRHCGKQ
jgi:hypothetical protein